MRKQELVHLHALCALVRSHVESRGDARPGAFSRYDELDVSPSAIYQDKRTHSRAVQRLADDVATVLEPDAQAVTTRGPDGPVGHDRDGRR